MSAPQHLECTACGRPEVPISGRVLVLCPNGRFPVFASSCGRCVKTICLDCASRVDVPPDLANLVERVRPGVRFLTFRCPSCLGDFPSDRYPLHLFVYEGYLGDLDHSAIARINEPGSLLRLYGYDISRVHGLKGSQRDIPREDGLAALLTVGVPGVMPIRCSSGTVD